MCVNVSVDLWIFVFLFLDKHAIVCSHVSGGMEWQRLMMGWPINYFLLEFIYCLLLLLSHCHMTTQTLSEWRKIFMKCFRNQTIDSVYWRFIGWFVGSAHTYTQRQLNRNCLMLRHARLHVFVCRICRTQCVNVWMQLNNVNSKLKLPLRWETGERHTHTHTHKKITCNICWRWRWIMCGIQMS